jgi:hypothetical protein
VTTDEGLGGPSWHNWSGDGPPGVAVVEAVAAATDRDPLELPPLSEVIDPDALEGLLDPDAGVDDAKSNLVQVSFEYAGVVVLIDSTGLIELREEMPGGK